MLKPEFIQNLPDRMIRLYEQAEADILADMARRISQYDYWIPAVEHQAKMLEQAGMVREEIISRMKQLTGKSERELTELMKEAGTAALKSDDEVYRRNGLNPSPIAASKDLQKVLQAGYEQTAGEFSNLTMTTAKAATQQFEKALDRAYMQIAMGGMDYNTSIRNAIKQLSADGVGAVKYPSGRIDSIEVAVRRATITGVNQTALKLQEARADEMHCDLVEVSAHSGARPEHAKWQGGIYSRSGKSKKYPDFRKTTGYGTGAGLGGWNCSHSFRPYFEGMSHTYDKELLDEYDAKKFEYNGKKLTEYEALQEQRYIERGIRRWKREQIALRAAGQDTSEASAMIRSWQEKEKDFLHQTGLKKDSMRSHVATYSRAEANKMKAEAERYYKEWISSMASEEKPKNLAEYYDMKYNNHKQYEVLKREAATILKIRNKETYSEEYREKMINTYYDFRGKGYEFTDHSLNRFLGQKKGKDKVSFDKEKLLEVLSKDINYKENDRTVKFYDGIAVIQNKETKEIVSIVTRKNPKGGWEEYEE